MNELQLFLKLAPIASASCFVALILTLTIQARKLVFLSLYLIACILIVTCQELEVTSTKLEFIMMWSRLTYTVIAFLPVFWILFAFAISRESGYIQMKFVIALLAIPFLTVAVAWSNSTFHLLWKEHGLIAVGPFVVNQVRQYGPWFWVHVSYSYILFWVGAVHIAHAYLKHHRLYRVQGLLVLIGATLPLIFNLVYIFRVFGPMLKDYSVLILSLSGICFAGGVWRFSLGRIVPIQRGRILDSMDEGVIALDNLGKVVDFNSSAEQLFQFGKIPPLGTQIAQLIPGMSSELLNHQVPQPVYWFVGGEKHFGQLRSSPVRSGDMVDGWVLTIVERTPTHISPVASLSRAEEKVLKFVNQDYSNKEVAHFLGITEGTVKIHVHHLLAKYGVQKRGDLKRISSERAQDASVDLT